jgi:hypothetical protein
MDEARLFASILFKSFWCQDCKASNFPIEEPRISQHGHNLSGTASLVGKMDGMKLVSINLPLKPEKILREYLHTCMGIGHSPQRKYSLGYKLTTHPHVISTSILNPEMHREVEDRNGIHHYCALSFLGKNRS